jgi:hypothetical protein
MAKSFDTRMFQIGVRRVQRLATLLCQATGAAPASRCTWYRWLKRGDLGRAATGNAQQQKVQPVARNNPGRYRTSILAQEFVQQLQRQLF